MKTILLIGGTGFFGKSFINYFKQYSFSDWGIDDLIVTSRKPINNLMGVRCVQFDANKNDNIPKADYIIYAASSSDESLYRSNAQEELNNQNNAIENFDKILKKNQQIKKILYTSSGSIYGKQNLLLKQTNEITTNIMPSDNNFPKNIYSEIKGNWENYFINNHNSLCVIARCFAFVGEYLPLNKHFAIGNFISDVLQNRDVEIEAKTAVFRSYMYSEDLVKWLLTMLTTKYEINKYGNIFNVGSSESIEIHELAQNISKIAQRRKLNYKFNQKIIDYYVPDINLAKMTFGLKIKNTLNDSIMKTLNLHGFRLYDY